MQADLAGAFITIISTLFFALNILLIRKAVVTGDPIDAVAAMLWIGTLIFVPLAFLLRYPNFGLTIKSLSSFLATGLTGTFLGRFCYYEGARKVGASRTAPIGRSSLLVATLLGFLILEETITEGHLSGIILLAAGVVIVSYETESNGSKLRRFLTFKILYPLGAMFFFGIGTFFMKVGLSEGTPLAVGMAIQFSAALVGLCGFLSWKRISPFRPFVVDEKLLFAGAGLLYSIAMGLFFWAVGISRLVVVAPIRGVTPLIVLILSYIAIRRLENITNILVFGSVLVVAGAMLVGIYM